MKRKSFLSILLALSLLAVAGCKKSPDSSRAAGGSASSRTGRSGQPIEFPVEVEPVQTQSLVYSVNAVGSVEAYEKVQVTARVPGAVDRVLFTEGSFAQVGQVLVEIETERYKLALEIAEAAAAKALASKADAEAGLKRRETVIAQTPGLIPGEEVETWKTKVLLAASDVAQAKSALNTAQLNLRDAYVRAPFSGIIQTRTVQTGQYVQTGTVLATLVRRDPLLIRFSVPEREAARIRPGMTALFKVRDDDREFKSRIIHVAEAADENSRLVDLTAQVDDSHERDLRPGTFAEITVPITTKDQALVIRQIAVRPSERGFVAYVVENGKAVEKILMLGMRTADGHIEVLSGLRAGEALVVRGAEALRVGAPVKVSPASPAGAPTKAPAESPLR
ncbi:MAG: efflux RND transporter periplasmic adaptor subunit [Candidatus Aminicenantes bacterium]|nr:efflux RND transporter periplasmic adaptor subunit [Candidatus Aminicenantes bacterium]